MTELLTTRITMPGSEVTGRTRVFSDQFAAMILRQGWQLPEGTVSTGFAVVGNVPESSDTLLQRTNTVVGLEIRVPAQEFGKPAGESMFQEDYILAGGPGSVAIRHAA